MEASTKFKRLSTKDRPRFQGRPFPSSTAIESEFPDEPAFTSSAPAAVMVPVPYDELQNDALAAHKYASGLTVTDQASLDAANDFLKDVKKIAARIGDTFDPLIKQAHEHHRDLIAKKKKFTDPLDLAERTIKPKIAAFLDAEEKKRREAERLRAEAEDLARIEAEKAVAKSDRLEAKGESEKAAQVVEKAYSRVDEIMSAAPFVPEAPIARGLTLTETWKFEIIDTAAVPREYCIPDEKKIGALVRGSKGEFKIPGVRVWSEKSVSSRI